MGRYATFAELLAASGMPSITWTGRVYFAPTRSANTTAVANVLVRQLPAVNGTAEHAVFHPDGRTFFTSRLLLWLLKMTPPFTVGSLLGDWPLVLAGLAFLTLVAVPNHAAIAATAQRTLYERHCHGSAATYDVYCRQVTRSPRADAVLAGARDDVLDAWARMAEDPEAAQWQAWVFGDEGVAYLRERASLLSQ
jgi:hypothetical protein